MTGFSSALLTLGSLSNYQLVFLSHMETDENMIVESSKCGSSGLNIRGRVCEVCGTGAVLQSQTQAGGPWGSPHGLWLGANFGAIAMLCKGMEPLAAVPIDAWPLGCHSYYFGPPI